MAIQLTFVELALSVRSASTAIIISTGIWSAIQANLLCRPYILSTYRDLFLTNFIHWFAR